MTIDQIGAILLAIQVALPFALATWPTKHEVE